MKHTYGLRARMSRETFLGLFTLSFGGEASLAVGFQHTVTSDTGVWDSGPIDAGAHFGHVFKKAGAVHYHCTIQPFMHALITVKR